eukprot:879980_1
MHYHSTMRPLHKDGLNQQPDQDDITDCVSWNSNGHTINVKHVNGHTMNQNGHNTRNTNYMMKHGATQHSTMQHTNGRVKQPRFGVNKHIANGTTHTSDEYDTSTATSHHHRPPPVHMDAPRTDVKVNGQQTNTRSNDRTCDPCHRVKAHGITSKEDIVATKTDESKVNKAKEDTEDTQCTEKDHAHIDKTELTTMDEGLVADVNDVKWVNVQMHKETMHWWCEGTSHRFIGD